MTIELGKKKKKKTDPKQKKVQMNEPQITEHYAGIESLV